MKLYHTGQVEIRTPDIRHGRVNADFGQGFYMTPDADFTYRWARADAVVNAYELDLTGLDVRRFARSAEWFDYIYNRRAKDLLEADVVVGPIANDTIFDTFGIISSGYLRPGDALDLLMIGPEYTQVAVKTDRAAAQLKWLGAETVTDAAAHAAALRGEREEYDRLFAAALDRLRAAR
ncbi:MAG: DUF3990 domain-containing protein [Clostridiales bacterium]|nr:DUF3990 domain-containing protein [Clostridiales bacterium]